MVIGIRKFGKTNLLDGQYIITYFIILGFPLIPVNSIFSVNDTQQINIGINLKSVIKTYFSWLFLLLTIIFFFGANYSNIFPVNSLFSILIAIFCGVVSLYFFTKFGVSSSNEVNKLRKIYFNAIGINFLPVYFSISEAENFQKELLMTLKDKYNLKDWKSAIIDGTYSEEQIPLLFVVSGFQYRINNSKVNQDVYNKILNDYKSRNNF